MAHEPPAPQWRQDEVTLQSLRARTASLEESLRGARREKREALDWMKRQIEALLDDPATTRRALRDRLYTIALRAEAGPPWPE